MSHSDKGASASTAPAHSRASWTSSYSSAAGAAGGTLHCHAVIVAGADRLADAIARRCAHSLAVPRVVAKHLQLTAEVLRKLATGNEDYGQQRRAS